MPRLKKVMVGTYEFFLSLMLRINDINEYLSEKNFDSFFSIFQIKNYHLRKIFFYTNLFLNFTRRWFSRKFQRFFPNFLASFKNFWWFYSKLLSLPLWSLTFHKLSSYVRWLIHTLAFPMVYYMGTFFL